MRVMNDGPAVLARSPAKLNLLLSICGRRPDGFHELETLMIKVSLFDTLTFLPRRDDALTLRLRPTSADLAAIPTGPENLVLRAAELLRQRAGVDLGADVVLDKRIPAEAGLAGGSGNAAATLAGLNRLWRLNLDREELTSLAAGLGSDIPFFLSQSNAAIARGRGEQTEAVSIGGPLHFVLVKPPFGLSTADVYRSFAERGRFGTGRSEPLVADLAAGRLASASRRMTNDLTPAAEHLRPELLELRSRLARECTHGGLMTGSGSVCFGLCGSAREATTAAARLRPAGLGRVFTASSA
jgi:4-diphosphocytidyl-2-C-methyl-D-erythritol kinase